MANPNKSLYAQFKSFDGVNIAACHDGNESIRSIENFEIESDDSLKKRSGFRHRFHFLEGEIKAVWSGRIKGDFKCYIVINDSIYAFIPEENRYFALGNITASATDISFFYYNDTLFLKDCESFYRVDASSISRIEGYVPLYGKEWPTTYPGEIYQPLNLMHRKARISYVVTTPYTSMLPTKLPVKNILAVYKNGSLLSASDYHFDSDFKTINLHTGVKEGEKFMALLEFEESNDEQETLANKCQYSKVLGTMDDPRIAIWGARSNPTYMFISSSISNDDYTDSESLFPGSGRFYFKKENCFKAGDGSKGITAVLRSYDRLLVFTEDEAWMSNAAIAENDRLPLTSMNAASGCSSFYGSAIAENDPITVGYQGIMRWTPDRSDTTKFKPYNISAPIQQELSRSFLKNARVYNDIYKKQLWFLEEHSKGSAWIYNTSKNSWVKFTGLKNAGGIFDIDGKTAFFSGNDIFEFSNELTEDHDQADLPSPITASLKSGILDFGSNQNKRLLGCGIIADLGNDALEIEISCNTGENIRFSMTSFEEHSISYLRLRSGRFITAYLSLKTQSKSRQTIHSITLKAKEKSKE